MDAAGLSQLLGELGCPPALCDGRAATILRHALDIIDGTGDDDDADMLELSMASMVMKVPREKRDEAR